MTKKELLTTYRSNVIELEELRRQLKQIGNDGRPSGIRSMQLDSIRGTNDPAAASMQLTDGLEALLERKETELATLALKVDALLRSIRDFRTYLIVYHYYVLGHTDEQVARALSISRVRALQLRQRFSIPPDPLQSFTHIYNDLLAFTFNLCYDAIVVK